MKETEAYREAIVEAVRTLLTKRENTVPNEQKIRKMVSQLTDSELADGMPFNTPEEIAELLLEEE